MAHWECISNFHHTVKSRLVKNIRAIIVQSKPKSFQILYQEGVELTIQIEERDRKNSLSNSEIRTNYFPKKRFRGEGGNSLRNSTRDPYQS